MIIATFSLDPPFLRGAPTHSLTALLLSPPDFMPHGFCYRWVPNLVWLHAISDSLIFLAYMTIPFTLIHIVRRRKDLPFNWILVCFGIFIVACGLTHIMEVWNLWHADYWLAGAIKAITAAASILTAILLIQLVPKALSLPDVTQWAQANAALEEEVQERRRLELELRLTVADYRKTAALLDLTHDAIFVRNLNNEIVFWNDAAEKLYGWTSEETRGKTTHALLQTIFPEPLHDIEAAILKTGYWEGQLIQQRRDGAPLTISSRWALRLEDGKPTAVLESNRDITHAKLDEQKFRNLLESAPDAMVIADAQGQIVLLNAETERLFGYTRDELIGRPVEMLVPERFRDQHPRHRHEYSQHPQTRTMGAGLNLWALRKNGSEFPVEISLSPLETPDGMLITTAIRDVTAQRAADQALRASDLKFRGILESAPDAMVISDSNGRILLVNAETERVFGYPRKELFGQPVEMLVPTRFRAKHPDHRQRYAADPLTRSMGAGLDLWGLRKDGSQFPIEISLSPIETPEGLLISSAIRDVTTNKQAEQALRTSEQKFRGILDSAPDAMVISDAHGRVVLLNTETERLFGYTRDELFGQPVEMLVPQRFRANHPHHRHEYSQHPQTRTMGAGLNLWALRKDGTEFPVEISLSPLETPEGTLVTTAIRDITERKLAEAALQESEERLSLLFQGVKDYAFVTLDTEGRVTTWNEGAQRIKGYQANEIIGRHFSTFFEPEAIAHGDPARELVTAAEHGSYQEEGWRVRKDGSRFWANILISSLRDHTGHLRGYGKVVRDITERKQSEEQLTAAMHELKRSNEELQQFAYVVSHDLQEPLRMVASYTQLLAKRYQGQLDSDADEFIRYAVDGCNRMQGLIQDLLAYSRAGSKQDALRRISTANALAHALKSLQTVIQENGALVTHDALPAAVADEAQLAQVFQNLIANAIKYRGPDVPQVHVSATKNGHREFIFSVRDNGLGIESQYFERIFVLFQRLHGREEFEGTGIGLAICKKILERMGGKIWVESQVGKGSTFYFSLPMGKDA